MILITFLILAGFLVVVARGVAIPMMNKNEGKIKSAGVRPFHYAWSKNQGGCGP
jgi:hypothetical protein